MAQVLDKTSLAIELARRALETLLKKDTILSYKLKEKRNHKDLYIDDLSFEVKFGNKKSKFELRIGLNKKTEITSNVQHSKMLLDIGDIVEPESLAEIISRKIPIMPKFEFHQSGIEEEKRYEVEVLKWMKEIKIIEGYSRSSKGENLEGVSFFIQYKGKEVPVRTKSSKAYQKEHKIRFPKIPSIIVKGRFRNMLFQYTINFLEAYVNVNRKVIHV